MTSQIIALLLSLLLIAGCGLIPPPPPPPLPPTGSSLNIDRALLEPCKELKPLKSGKEADVISWAGDVKVKNKECSSNHQGLVNAIKGVK